MDPFRAAMTSEFDEFSDRTCLVSSEMFYSCDLTRLAEVFTDIPSRALADHVYCRRYSDFLRSGLQAARQERAFAGRCE